MFIEGFLGYEYIRLELFDTPVPGLIGITLRGGGGGTKHISLGTSILR